MHSTASPDSTASPASRFRRHSPALVAVDIDGTLLTSAGTVLPGTRAEFARARAAGATIVLASGRPIAGLRRLARRLRLDTAGFVFVGGNGSVAIDVDSGEQLLRRSLPFEEALGMIRYAVAHDILVMVCDGDELVVDRPDDPQVAIEADGNDLRVRAVPDLTQLCVDDGVTVDKLLMYPTPERLRPFGADFAQEFDGVETAFSAPFYFEATAGGVDKGSALASVAQAKGAELGECVAFGDNGNDLPMLRAAGLGVAMANATAAVQEAADRVTASHDDEGIAAVLAELFGGGRPAPPVPEPSDIEPLYALDLREIGGLVHPDDAPAR